MNEKDEKKNRNDGGSSSRMNHSRCIGMSEFTVRFSAIRDAKCGERDRFNFQYMTLQHRSVSCFSICFCELESVDERSYTSTDKRSLKTDCDTFVVLVRIMNLFVE